MKYFLFLLFLFALPAVNNVHAQPVTIEYGFNGSHTAENLTPEVIALLDNMVPPGGILAYRIRDDKNVGKMTADQVNNIIALKRQLKASGKTLHGIYTFEASKPVDISFSGFEALKDSIILTAAEIDNEAYADSAGYNQLWNVFQGAFQKVVDRLKQEHFTGKILFPLAPNPIELPGKDKMQEAWNTAGISYMKTDQQFEAVYHFYIKTAIFLTDVKRDKLTEEISNGVYLSAKDNFYEAMLNQFLATDELTLDVNYNRQKLPGKKMWFTEVGWEVSVGNIDNTIATGMGFFALLNQTLNFQDDIAVFLKHNGPTTPSDGIITSAKKDDVQKGGFLPRMAYFVLKLFLSNMGDADRQAYWNVTRSPIAQRLSDVTYLKGENYYSSSGHCDWWADGSVKSYEISQLLQLLTDQLPPISFGYITQHTEDTIIQNCRDTVRIVGYVPVITTKTVYDTVPKAYCEDCEKLGYYMRHRFTCRMCKRDGFDIISTTTSDTSYNAVLLPFTICDTITGQPEDTTGDPQDDDDGTIDEIQKLNADTLFFQNEFEFEEFLSFYNIARYSVEEGMTTDCHVLPEANSYPELLPDDYLHEERFEDDYHNLIFDHNPTRKIINIFLPLLNDPAADFCDVTMTLQNPSTGQYVVFYDIMNWINENGKSVFNTNEKVYLLWNYTSGPHDFPIKMIHESTGYSYAFEAFNPAHTEVTLKFNDIESVFGYMKQLK